MKKLWMIILVSGLIVCPVFADGDPNIIVNPGFESDMSNWWRRTDRPPVWQIDSSIAHSGNKSLRITNLDPAVYIIAGQQFQIPLNQSGRQLTYSAWVKADLPAGSRGFIVIECHDSDGKTVFDSYNYFSASSVWEQKVKSVLVPSNATNVFFGFSVNPGSTGSIWFDDVEVTNPLTLSTMLRDPSYRNTLYPGQANNINLAVMATGNAANPESDFYLKGTIYDAQKKSVSSFTKDYSAGQSSFLGKSFALDFPDIPSGTYQIAVSLLSKNSGLELKKYDQDFIVADPAAVHPRVYIDSYNRTVVNGELYFPSGFYSSGTLTNAVTELDRMKDSKFNVQLWYGSDGVEPALGKAYLDAAQARNIKIIYSIQDCYDGAQYAPKKIGTWNGPFEIFKGYVSTFKDHPALLAWYTSDELDVGYIDQLQGRYDWLKANDYNHPAYQVLSKGQNVKDHFANTDVFGQDIYPVWDTQSLTAVTKTERFGVSARDMREKTMASRAVWMVPECLVYSSSNVRAPTYQEMINYIYQGLVNGARGFIFYDLSYLLKDPNGEALWQTMKLVGEHIDQLKPFGLALDAPVEKSLSVSVPNAAMPISVLTRDLGTQGIYCLAVNPYHEAVTGVFTLGSGLTVRTVSVGLPGAIERSLDVVNGKFSDTIEPLGTRVYMLGTLSGDVSGDGRVTMYDAALVLKYTVGGALSSAQQSQADINSDTTVDVADAMAIAKKALGLN